MKIFGEWMVCVGAIPRWCYAAMNESIVVDVVDSEYLHKYFVSVCCVYKRLLRLGRAKATQPIRTQNNLKTVSHATVVIDCELFTILSASSIVLLCSVQTIECTSYLLRNDISSILHCLTSNSLRYWLNQVNIRFENR